MSSGDEMVSVAMSRTQVAQLRAILFRQLDHDAGNLAKDARRAGETPSCVIGEDTRGTYYTIMGETVGLLDAIGWSTEGDHELLIGKVEA